jgi:hypothetical protein
MPLVEEIKALLEEFEDFSAIHVRRSCNEVAHRLAKEGYGNKLSATWHGTTRLCNEPYKLGC